jgi:hypothetical protein
VFLSTVETPLALLSTGQYENVQISRLAVINDRISKYRIDAVIKSKEMNRFLADYKVEMKTRKVLFPGFRPGVLPPYAMTDVRKYLVCFGLDTYLGEICNVNELTVIILPTCFCF